MKYNFVHKNIRIIIGLLFIFMGVICNEWIFTSLGLYNNSFSEKILFWFIAIIFIIIGFIFLKTRDIQKLKELLKNFSLLSISFIICLFIFEVVLRIFTPQSIFHPGLNLRPNQEIKIKVNLPGVSNTNYHSTNKWGMRGDPIPKDLEERTTIVTIGGSTTHCFYLSDNKTWPAILQKLLRKLDKTIMVQNAGLDGHTTRGHLLMMEKVITKIKPDIVILLVGANDLGLSLNEDRLIFGTSFEKTGLKYYLFTHSRVFQFINTWRKILINKAPIIDKTKFGYERYTPQPISERSPLPDSLETILPSLYVFKNNIKRIIDISTKEDIKIIFLTQPMLYDDNEYWDGILGYSFWLKRQKLSISACEYWKMLKLFNETLITICKKRNIPCFDLSSNIPHSTDYFIDCAHFSEAGAELVAKELFDFIKKEKYIIKK